MANPFALATSLAVPLIGNANGTNYTMGREADQTGLVISAYGIGYAGSLPTTASIFQKGCAYLETDTGSNWVNVGTTASPSWHLIY